MLNESTKFLSNISTGLSWHYDNNVRFELHIYEFKILIFEWMIFYDSIQFMLVAVTVMCTRHAMTPIRGA